MFENWNYLTIKAMLISLAVIFGVGNLFITMFFKHKKKRDKERLEKMSLEELDMFIKSCEK